MRSYRTLYWVHTCSCGRQYTLAEWKRLKLVGPMDDGEGDYFVLRNCVCGSTRAVKSTVDDAYTVQRCKA